MDSGFIGFMFHLPAWAIAAIPLGVFAVFILYAGLSEKIKSSGGLSDKGSRYLFFVVMTLIALIASF